MRTILEQIDRIPGWIRALLIVLLLPALWAMEIRIGTTLVQTPELIYGDFARLQLLGIEVFPVVFAVLILWILIKTPVALLSLAYGTGGTAVRRSS